MTNDELTQRLERIERRLTRTRAAGVAWAALAGAAFWIGRALGQEAAPPPAPVEASGYVLVDASGARRAALVPVEDGGARLEFYDASGAVRSAVGRDADGPMFYFDDEEGQRRIEMEISGTRGVFQLLDRQGVNVYQKRW